jgi:iron-sulfur cluster insertion protein
MIKEIKFTDKALKQINSLLSKKDEGSFFRIAIKGGGCSGFQYEFSFEKNKNNDDLSFENILIDQTSADLLKGSEVDYVSELIMANLLRSLTHKPNPHVVVVYRFHFNDHFILEC